jgi:hypothetical protein
MSDSEFVPRTASEHPRHESAPGLIVRSGVGIAAFAIALVTIVLVWIGITVALSGKFEASVDLAYAATSTSVIAVITGAAAALLRRGRAWGLTAIALALLGTPLVITHLLGWLSALN